MSLTRTLAALALVASVASAQIPILEYNFDQGGAPTDAINSGTLLPGLYPITGQTLNGIGPNGTPALQGVTGLSENVATPLTIDQLTGDWSVAFFIDGSDSFATGGTALQYVFGAGSDSWRVFYGGVAGTDGIIMRGPMTDCLIPGGRGTTGFVHVAWVYDSAAGTVTGYLNGTAVTTVTTGFTATGTGAVTVGAYPLNTASLGVNDEMDSVQVYDVALDPTAVASIAAGNPPVPLAPIWQLNSAASSLDFNGVQGTDRRVAAQSVPQGSLTVANLDSTLTGSPFDVLLSLSAPISGDSGALALPSGQFIHVNPFDPSTFFVFGGSLANPLAAPFPGTLALPFSAPAAPFLIGVQKYIADPASADGITFSQASQLETFAPTSSSDFESGFPSDWTNGANGSVAWTVDSGGTPSTATGPTTATSGANYLYCETSGGGTGATFIFDTSAIDRGSLINQNLDFQLSRIGATIGTLTIYADDGSGTFATTLATYTGADLTQTQGGVEYSAESIPLGGVPAGPIVIRFEYVAGTSFTGDLAIDDISIN